jgi:hypothetical protein
MSKFQIPFEKAFNPTLDAFTPDGAKKIKEDACK